MTGSQGAGARMYTANDLRRIAESADGTRSGPLELVSGANGLELRPILAGQVPSDGAIIVETKDKASGRRKLTNVELTLESTGAKKSLPPHQFDSVFWSEAAAEKFLVPYYVSFLSDADMTRLKDAIASPEIVAIAHVYPTFFLTITSALTSLFVLPAGPGAGLISEFIPLSEWRPLV
jgi:hypothetical protein